MDPLPLSTEPAASAAEPRAALVQALWRHRFARILAEMAAGVEHSALSLELAHGGALACALLDRQGFAVAEHGATLRAGALGPQVRAALARHAAPTPEQVLVVGDPLDGGSDLGTLTLLALVAGSDGAPLGYLAVSIARGDCVDLPTGPPEAQVDLLAEALPLPKTAPGEAFAELPPAVGPRYRSFHSAETTRTAGLPRSAGQEGWSLAPMLLTDAALQMLVHKQRDPIAASADLKAARGALRWGAQHLRALDKRHGAATVREHMAQQQEDTRAMLAAALQRIPAGVCAFADSLDDDGAGASDLPVRVTIHLGPSPESHRITLDFRESADAAAGAVNTVPAVVHAAVRCALSALLPPGVATNDGLHGLFKILLRKGSLLDAGPPHAVAAGATETAQRIIDVVLGALSQALPQPIRAASAGTCSSLTLRAPLAAASPPTPAASPAASAGHLPTGAVRPPVATASLPAGDAGAPSGPVSAAAFGANRTSAADPATTADAGASAVAASPGAAAASAPAGAASRRFYLHEFLAGGLGASPAVDGATGQHAPAGPRGLSSELLEQRLPVRVLRLEVRADSGGGGVRTGGSGLRRELLLLETLHVELCGERRRRPPYGLGGGGPGQLGRDTLIRDGAARPLPAKARLVLSAGDILRTESPGGGGYGDPMRAAFFAALLA